MWPWSRLFPETLGEIFCGGIGEHRDDDGVLITRNLLCYVEAAEQCGGRAGAHEQSFFARNPFNQVIGIFRADFEIFVSERVVVDGWANRGFHVLPAFESVEGSVGLQADETDRGIQLFEPARYSDESAAGAEACDEMGDAPGALLPNLVGGRVVMGLPVCWIAVLIRIEIFLGVRS